jgi:dipeptidyl aminopeptidase/acylaminoacyl peptidase
MNVVPVVRSLENADADNIFLYGESRGGMMVLQAVRDGFPANAAATYGAFSDFEALVKTDPKLYDPLIKVLWPDYEIKKRESADRRSAIKWADRLNVPLLLMQGGSDRSVDPMQTLKFAERLQELGKPYELIVFAGDNHTLTRHQAERDARAAAWFKAHIRK